MFSYPSGSQLHAGHWFNYGPVDLWLHLKECKDIMYSNQWDFVCFRFTWKLCYKKTGIHPQDSTIKNIAKMEEQLKAMGAMFNWENEVKLVLPEYYKWTQWLFLKLYEKGFSYRKKVL